MNFYGIQVKFNLQQRFNQRMVQTVFVQVAAAQVIAICKAHQPSGRIVGNKAGPAIVGGLIFIDFCHMEKMSVKKYQKDSSGISS